jgi:two-component system, LytTR family, response regulator
MYPLMNLLPHPAMINAIIIDDEALAREVIKAYLKGFSQVSLVAECGDGFEGLKAIQEHKPDLVFLDIQMPKLTGFEMLELVETMPVVVFSTAYDEFALKAFELSAADYLLKPYSQARFAEAMQKVLARVASRDASSEHRLLDEFRSSSATFDRVVMRLGSKIIIIGVDQIDFVSAEDDYVAIHSEGKKYLKQMTMRAMEEGLPAQAFVRVHRSYLVAIKAINRLEAYSKDSYMAILHSGEKVPVSRTGYQALREALHF